MGISIEVRGQLVLRFRVLFPHLNERQQRLVLGQEARLLGDGGVRAVGRAAGSAGPALGYEVTAFITLEIRQAGGHDPWPIG